MSTDRNNKNINLLDQMYLDNHGEIPALQSYSN